MTHICLDHMRLGLRKGTTLSILICVHFKDVLQWYKRRTFIEELVNPIVQLRPQFSNQLYSSEESQLMG